MQQAALNLIAIGVFAMTLSSLLGPMLNISPTIPAIATISILGLATLDTLSFQGKGITILLEVFASADSKYRDRVLRHEAGHFLVAYLLEIPITGYTLSAWETVRQGNPGQGGVIFDTQKLQQEMTTPWEMQVILDRFCTVWMAGIAAEILVYGSAEGGAEDRQKIREVTLGRQESDAQQKERASAMQARTLIEENYPAYEALVATMEQRASVEECYQVLQQRIVKS
ncbi:ATP-dependent Zn protease [Coleofasciculus sp. FACHB-1120]|uniref:ATP-dependent Zn protease n=1 Tax=Coleofasciculus sp. FACHB-1120 TaxID=2692783 RepID=UPI001682DE50|nr:ATP-dependent Zn protease [Coleofasciculus sp. FACHB-1120]MBD2740496.1 ATP-dependent Zn protease [Coleofasciculus sp. FACHB-1120]